MSMLAAQIIHAWCCGGMNPTVSINMDFFVAMLVCFAGCVSSTH
jgi:hypothetical protein